MRVGSIVSAWVALLVLVVSAAAAHAGPDKSKRKRKGDKPPPAATVSEPTNARCIRATDRPHLDCSYIEGTTIEVRMDQGVSIRVTDDEIAALEVPEPYIFFHKTTSDTVTFAVSQRGWPARTSAMILTKKGYRLVVFFVDVEAGQGDRTVSLTFADRAEQDAIVERRVAAHKKELDAKDAEREASFKARVDDEVRTRMLDIVFEGGSSIGNAGGPRVTRDDFLVLRTGKIYRMGKHRLLYVTLRVENRDDDTVQLAPKGGSFRVWRTRGKDRKALAFDGRCNKVRLPGGAEALCVLAFTFNEPMGDDDRLRVEFKEERGDRTVTLDGIDVR